MLLHIASRLRLLSPLRRSISTVPTTASAILVSKSSLIQVEMAKKCSPMLSALQQKYIGNATLDEITELVESPQRVRGAIVLLLGELFQKLPQVVIWPELAEHQKAIATTVEMANLAAQMHEKVKSHQEEAEGTTIDNKLAILFGDYIFSQEHLTSVRFKGSIELLRLLSTIVMHRSEAVFEAEVDVTSAESWLCGQFRRHVIPLALGCQSVARITLPPSEQVLISSAYEFGINFGHFWRIQEVLEQETSQVDRNQLKTYSAEFQNKALDCLEQFPVAEGDAKKCFYELLKPSRHLR